eukprot:c18881_g1_i2.p1 GENE.c18881_g1_i2~~c18881_g1_i2.p1  ORF type:complete len:345 (+),score=67.38 c18881_g1_i2:25-1059(+)
MLGVKLSHVVVGAVVAGFAVVFGFLWIDQHPNITHFSNEPFSWPAELVYTTVPVSDDLSLSVVQAGPKEAEKTILFIHGFPESAYEWKEYLVHYASLGYRVIAPDTRFVNTSQPIDDTSELTLDVLADDMAGLLRELKCSDVVVVSHDWGSGIASALAVKYPALVKAWVSFNIPHPSLYRKHNLRGFPFSLGFVWYFLFWGLGGSTAVTKVRSNDYGFLLWFFFQNSRPHAYSAADLAHYKTSWDRTGKNLLRYYKMGTAALIQPGRQKLTNQSDTMKPISCPTLFLFGSGDAFVDPATAVAALNAEYIAHPNKKLVLFQASHWLPKERPQECIREIDSFLSGL